jgi:hypothetical protein
MANPLDSVSLVWMRDMVTAYRRLMMLGLANANFIPRSRELRFKIELKLHEMWELRTANEFIFSLLLHKKKKNILN